MKHAISLGYRLFAAVTILLTSTAAVGQSIYFHPAADWKSVLKAASSEGKLVFVDVYTDWCGPCKMMEANVFSRPEVAKVYNAHFVNYKLDAEKGEGIELKKKYGVQVYPTYLFIDPVTEELVHKSTSRQDPEVFIQTGLSALQPATRSVVMEKQYLSGLRTPALLKAYAAYLHSIYQHEKLDTLMTTYFRSKELTDTLAWHLFTQYQQSTNSPQFKYLVQNRSTLTNKYGKEAVDRKIASAYEYDLSRVISQGIYNASRFDEAAYQALKSSFDRLQFEGKDLVAYKATILDQFRNKNYVQAADLADNLPAIAGITKQEVLDFYHQLYFFSRSHTDITWMGRALAYTRYIAANDTEGRAKAEIHYNYARMLENYLQLLKESGTAPAKNVLKAPVYGEVEYTLRPADLKLKPQRNKK